MRLRERWSTMVYRDVSPLPMAAACKDIRRDFHGIAVGMAPQIA